MKKTTLVGLLLTVWIQAGFADVDFHSLGKWQPAGEVASFPPGKLWEVIDGAAELYLAYEVQELQICDLTTEDTAVTVMIFDMTTPLNAFGIFGTERPSEATLPIGTAACLTPPYQGLLLKDRFYVKVDAYEGELNERAGSELLAALANQLPGSTDTPVELAKLPVQGRIAGTEGYIAEGYLGLKDLNHCLHATCELGEGRSYQVFLVFPATGQTVASTWSHLAKTWQPASGAAGPALVRSIPYRGLAGVILTSSGILGVAGAENQDELLAAFAELEASPLGSGTTGTEKSVEDPSP